MSGPRTPRSADGRGSTKGVAGFFGFGRKEASGGAESPRSGGGGFFKRSESAPSAPERQPSMGGGTSEELVSVELHRDSRGSLALEVSYHYHTYTDGSGGESLPIVVAPAPGEMREGDEIFAVDGVALEPGARLGEVLERREMHHFVVRREPNALERGKARRLSSY